MRAAARFSSQLIAWFRQSKRDLPWRRTRDPYAIWISEVMLQQTQVRTVIPYWARWMKQLPTVVCLANANPERVLKLWEGLGYYSRARNLQKAAQKILLEHGGKFPTAFDDILNLPGIGRYTAGAIGSIAFGLPTPIVDGNVARVLARYLGLKGDPKSKTTNHALWEAASKLVKAAHEFDACGDLNEAMMELGATICLPREPKCSECPIQQKCYARQHGKVAELPEVAARAASQAKLFRAALIHTPNGIFMRQRPVGVVNAGFWELPNIEAKKESAKKSFEQLLGDKDIRAKRLCEVKHTITRFRMTLEVYAIADQKVANGKFLNTKALNELPLVNAHKKALEKIGYLNG